MAGKTNAGGCPKKTDMDKELQKAASYGLGGREREKAVDAFRARMEEWGCALPDTEILVSDFCLGRFPEIGLMEAWIANEQEGGYCGKYLFVLDGQRCPNHKHLTKQETFFVVKGTVEMTYGGRTWTMKPGDVLTITPGGFHTFVGKGPALLLEISMPCVVDDNFFENTSIPYGLNYKGGEKC